MKKYATLIASLTLVGASCAAIADDNDYSSTKVMAVDPAAYEGKDIMDSAGNQLGDIDEVVKDKSNRQMVVIDLEDSTKEVVIPIDRVSMSADGNTLTTTMTRKELEALPDYDPMDMESVDE